MDQNVFNILQKYLPKGWQEIIFFASYLKTVETGVNSIVFKDAYNRIIGSVSIVEGSNLVINTETTAQTMAEIVENMDVGDYFVLTSDATIEQIYAAQAAGNVCLLRHYSVSSLDPDDKTLDYCQPLMDNGEATSFNLFVSGANHYFTLIVYLKKIYR